MTQPPKNKPHILFLFSDTGGGHRSAAEAIIEAINLEFPEKFNCEMVDFFKAYAPLPFNLARPTYTAMSRVAYLWSLCFRISDDPDRIRVLYSTLWPYIHSSLKRLLEEHPCKMIVSVHPLINIPILRAIKGKHIPYIVVVTDLVSTHAAWFSNDADLIIIPTQQATRRAIRYRIQPEKLRIVRLPIANKFCKSIGDHKTLRNLLNWEQDLPIILLVGGGEGMGPIDKVAIEINRIKLPISLVVVTGHNKKLKKYLEEQRWDIPIHIYGFVNEMPEFIRAADILITKAGPGTISEAFIAGIPIILYHRITGQEEGNISFVVDKGAGIWAPEVKDVINAIKDWLTHPEKRLRAAQQALQLAQPDASRKIAHILAEYLATTKDG